MTRTYILVDICDKGAVWHYRSGLAKNAAVADWLFVHCGWRKSGGDLPDLVFTDDTDGWLYDFIQVHAGTILGGVICNN